MTRWSPSSWAGYTPNGLGKTKPNHVLEMVKTAWTNRDQLAYSWRILSRGVCDGCALGTTGMRDFTLPGIHLCTVRLDLLRLNTMGAIEDSYFQDVDRLRQMDSRSLRSLGRLPFPLVRHKGDRGFTRTSWPAALELIGRKIRQTDPQRLGFYLTSRGITNEVYYAAQKVSRFLGTNNVDNSSRVCHASSTTALKDTLGVSASTCSYTDWIGTDLLVLVGTDLANNQPVATKYLYEAKKRGTKIVVINPFKEPGLERYWIPSVPESAVFGTRLADRFFQVNTGGDTAFMNGVLKYLVENSLVDDAYIRDHTHGFETVARDVTASSWGDIERFSGCEQADIAEFARLYGQAKSAVFVWSMGITQHRYGVDNVKSIVNVALARGMLGKEKCGLMPIRGHSGVQGGAEMGCVPWNFPGGQTVNAHSAQQMSDKWSFAVPELPGMTAVEMIAAGENGSLDILYSVGGNFLETLPEPDRVQQSLETIPFRVHQDIVLSSQMLVDPAETVVVLPAATRYEQPGGGTETSTERRVYYSPEIPGRRIGEALPEWEILVKIAQAAYPSECAVLGLETAQDIRNEISVIIPSYSGIEHLAAQGDAFQWGGPRLCENGRFDTEDGKAVFTTVVPPEMGLDDGHFVLSTRRGKQFNSMIHKDKDPLTGAGRDAVFVSRADADRMNIEQGTRVLVRSSTGVFAGYCHIAEIKERNVQVYWPESNALIESGRTDPLCGIPDYNAIVTLESLSG